MFSMCISAYVDGLREVKDKGFYCDFAFVGGVITLSVDVAFADRLKAAQGSEVSVTFEMRPKTQVLYGDRAVTMFQPVAVLEIGDKK